MHIAVASHQPLPAKGYGGPQRVIMALVRGLATLGARVTLLAPPGTRVSEATVVEVPPRKFGDGTTLAPYIPRDTDLVHVHFPLRHAPRSPPFVQTVHGNLKGGAPPSPNSIFLSHDHARRHKSETFVYNGLHPADYVFRRFATRAAQPELVTPAVGALCDTMDEIIAAADRIQTRDPAACRAHAERFFTHLVMAGEYLRMYQHVLETGTLPAGRATPSVPA